MFVPDLSELATCVDWQGVPWLQVKLVHTPEPAAVPPAVHETVALAGLKLGLQLPAVEHVSPIAFAVQFSLPLPSVERKLDNGEQ